MLWLDNSTVYFSVRPRFAGCPAHACRMFYIYFKYRKAAMPSGRGSKHYIVGRSNPILLFLRRLSSNACRGDCGIISQATPCPPVTHSRCKQREFCTCRIRRQQDSVSLNIAEGDHFVQNGHCARSILLRARLFAMAQDAPTRDLDILSEPHPALLRDTPRSRSE